MSFLKISPGVKYIVLSTIFFALMNIGVKNLDRIPATEIVFFRAFVTLIIGYILIKREGLSPWGNNKKILILRGLAGTIGLVLYFYTLQVMPLASAVTIQYMSPIFTIIIAGFMLKEPARPIQWLFFLISFIGVVMIKGFDTRITIPELALGLTAAVCSGFAYNFIRKLKGQDHHLVIVFYFPLVTVPVVGSYMAFHWVSPDPYEWLFLLFVGVTTTIAQIFMTMGYQAEKAANISNYNYLGSIYALAFGYFLFGELISIPAMLGLLLIIIGVVACSRCNSK